MTGPIALPLRINAIEGGVKITDARGRAVYLYADADEMRRGFTNLWTPEEAQALAVTIARLLTSETQKAAATPKDDGGQV